MLTEPGTLNMHTNYLASPQIYEPFASDFGPLNLGRTYRFCEITTKMLKVGKLLKCSCINFERARLSFSCAARTSDLRAQGSRLPDVCSQAGLPAHRRDALGGEPEGHTQNKGLHTLDWGAHTKPGLHVHSLGGHTWKSGPQTHINNLTHTLTGW